ncbi:YqaA family protein [Calditrichota bacterium LG25]
MVKTNSIGIIKKMYDWLMQWAATPYAGVVLFFWALAESSFFPIPPDAFLIALVLGARQKALRFAIIASVASVIGGIIGYGIGHWLWWDGSEAYSRLALFFFNNVPGFNEHQFLNVRELYEKWNFWVVFTAGFTPIPYKVITVSAGAFKINFPIFLIASGISRAARFFLVSWLLWYFGEPIRKFIEKHLGWLSLAFVLLLIGGFILVKYSL